MSTPEEDRRRSSDAIFAEMIGTLKKDLDQHTKEENLLIVELRQMVEAFSSGASPDVQRKRNEYLDYLIDREKSRAQFRNAIIEKTMTSLVWSTLLFIGYSVLHYLFPARW